MSIVTFTPNPALDQTLLVESLVFDEPVRPLARHERAGGKGINVARAVRCLGGAARAYGVVAGATGRQLIGHLDDEAIEHRIDIADGPWETRTTTVVADDHRAILVYDEGEPIPPPTLLRAVERCVHDLSPGDALVVSGSLPPGDHRTALQRLLAGAQARRATTVVDSSGAGLELALAHGVDVIKVDRTEAAEVTGCQDPTAAATALLSGCRHAIVTMGANGAVAATHGATPVPISALDVAAQHPAGSGDAFCAGLTLARIEGRTWPEALRVAAAAGAANTLLLGAGALDRRIHLQLLDRIGVPAEPTP